jgi:hypothetical protein
MGKLVLLEPFRSALLVEGLKEGLVSLPDGVHSDEVPGFREKGDPNIQRFARQLLLVFEAPSIVNYDPQGSVESGARVRRPIGRYKGYSLTTEGPNNEATA